jgi:hypothetical protein
MISQKETTPEFSLFYGWYFLAASFIILFFNGAARVSIGAMFKPMIEEFGWSRSSMSLLFPLPSLVGFMKV